MSNHNAPREIDLRSDANKEAVISMTHGIVWPFGWAGVIGIVIAVIGIEARAGIGDIPEPNLTLYQDGDSLLKTTIQVDSAVFARMKERFETSDVVEITAVIATYNMVARFRVALEVAPET